MKKNKQMGVFVMSGALMSLPVLQITPVLASNVTTSSNVGVSSTLTKTLLDYEAKFELNSYFGNVKKIPTLKSDGTIEYTKDDSKSGYQYKEGRIPILISAPHSIKQPPRPDTNKFKGSDMWTGALVQYIAEQTGAHVIYKTSYTNVDDNFMGYNISNASKEATRTPYRDAIEDIIEKNDIKLVIDLHGFADSDAKNYGVVFGTGNGSNLLQDQGLLDEILLAFESNGYAKVGTEKAAGISKQFAYYMDGEYAAGIKNRTVTNYVASSLNTPAIQIELSTTNRNPEEVKYVKKSIDTIVDVINNVNAMDIGRTAEITSSSSVKLKSAPKASADDLMTIEKGKVVTILKDSSQSYFKVNYNGKTGYLKKADLTRVAQVKGVSSYINFRQNPDYDSKVIAKVNVNEYVKVLEVANNKFAKIEYGGTIGYVPSKFLTSVNSKTFIKDSISQISYTTKKTVTGVSTSLVLREGAGTDTNKITSIPLGEKVNIIEDNGSEWVKVAYKNNVGYVCAKYIK